jgi:hypothetical protein
MKSTIIPTVTDRRERTCNTCSASSSIIGINRRRRNRDRMALHCAAGIGLFGVDDLSAIVLPLDDLLLGIHHVQVQDHRKRSQGSRVASLEAVCVHASSGTDVPRGGAALEK